MKDGRRFLKERLSERRLIFYAIGMILVGSLFIAVSLVVEEQWKTHTAEIVLRFVDHVGVALISIGTIGIFLELRDLSNYFQKKIANTIVQHDYLRTLEGNQLQQLQSHVLQAYYALDEVDGEDSLLEYCQEKIHLFLADPYREDVLGFFNIAYTADRQNYVIDETISYTCRATNKCIQDEIRWTMEADEVVDLTNFEITLNIPPEEFNKPEFRAKHSYLEDPVVRFTMNHKGKEEKPGDHLDHDDMKHKWEVFWAWLVVHLWNRKEIYQPMELEEYTQGKGYTLKLKSFQHIDKMRVNVRIKFIAPLGRSPTWRMSHPSKKVTGIIVHPPETDFSLDTFGVKPGEIQFEKQPTSFSLRYDSWMLPQSGFAFHLVKRNSEQGAADIAN